MKTLLLPFALLFLCPAWASDWTALLDSRLSRWEVWMGAPHQSVTGLPPGTPLSANAQDGTPLGLGQDPKQVFTLIEQEGQLVLHISGEICGGLTTLAEFGDFHLSAQVKWGEKKWPPRVERKRDSGILYHCTGPHGAFWNVWKRCVEYQVQEADMGDLFLLAGTAADARWRRGEGPDGKPLRPVWDPAQPYSAGGGARSENFESPHGEWTTVEVYALGRRAIHLVNGHVVLALDNIRLKDGAPLSVGQIQIQSEGAEVYYRDLKIRRITAFPEKLAAVAGFQP